MSNKKSIVEALKRGIEGEKGNLTKERFFTPFFIEHALISQEKNDVSFDLR